MSSPPEREFQLPLSAFSARSLPGDAPAFKLARPGGDIAVAFADRGGGLVAQLTFAGKPGSACREALSLTIANADPARSVRVARALDLTYAAFRAELPLGLSRAELQAPAGGWARGDRVRVLARLGGGAAAGAPARTAPLSFTGYAGMAGTRHARFELPPFRGDLRFTRDKRTERAFEAEVQFERARGGPRVCVTLTLVHAQRARSLALAQAATLSDAGPVALRFAFPVQQSALCDPQGWTVADLLRLELTVAPAEAPAPAPAPAPAAAPAARPPAPRPAAPAPAPRPAEPVAGVVGLRNQGATCYMNSVLQALFWTPAFRRLVYEMPTTGAEDPAMSIPLCLQRLFCRMQLSDRPGSTVALTKSFGWDSLDTFVQHDVQEFERVLIDNLETKMKGTPLQGRVPALFRGHFRSYIRCRDIGYSSESVEEFYDLSMLVKGVSSLEDSFASFVEPELLTGENQYDTGKQGKHDAEIGIKFVDYPPVLHLHLRRFEYDYARDVLVKVNDRFAFPETIDLDRYLSETADRSRPATYDLYGVLVHSGSSYGGHYFAFLRTSTAGEWLKFDDTHVTRATRQQAITDNFGGVGYTNGYMLVYVRQADAPAVFEPVDDSFIPQHLREHDTTVATLKLTVVTEDCARYNCLNGRAGFACPQLEKQLQLPREDTNATVYQKVSEAFDVPVGEVRLWAGYSDGAPNQILPNNANRFTTAFKSLLLQRKPADEPVVLDPNQSTYFVKFYHPQLPRPLQYIGAFAAARTESVEALFPRVARVLGFPADTAFSAVQELDGGFVTRLITTFETVAVVILQLEAGKPLPPTGYAWAVDPVSPSEMQETDDPQFSELPLIRESGKSMETVADFLSGRANAILYRFEDPKTAVARLNFPTTLTMDELKVFVAGALGVPFNPASDAMLIFTADRSNPGIPEQRPIANIHGEVAYQFGKKKLHRIFARYVSGVTEARLSLMMDLEVEFSEDGYTVARATRAFFPSTPVLSEIRQRLIASQFIPDRPDLRFISTWNHTIRRILAPETTLHHCESLRIEIVPPDQATLETDSVLVRSSFAEIKTTLKAVGSPFLFVFKMNETVASLRQRVTAALKLSEADAKQIRLFVSDDAQLYSLADEIELKEGKSVQECIEAEKFEKPCLFLVRKGISVKSSSYRDQSVKIYN